MCLNQNKDRHFTKSYSDRSVVLKYITVKTMKNVRGHFAAFLAFKTKNQRQIIILLFETLQLWFKWNFCRINQYWATSPMDLKNHDGTKK